MQKINAAAPDILLVGLGMPLQEYWLMENRHRLDAGVALTGGAVFDYVSGRLRRGPRLLVSGFEWLARLLIDPAACGEDTRRQPPFFLTGREAAPRVREKM